MGSAKCAAITAIQSGPATQSLSRNATSGVAARARPSLRAGPGPPDTGRRRSRAPCRWHTRAVAAGSAEPSSTTITG